MTTKKPWADEPYKLISGSESGAEAGKKLTGSRCIAAQMTIIHNWILRGANAIHLQCVNVVLHGSEQDIIDFVCFAYQWFELVHEHHESEETDVFPKINELAGVEGLMDVNVEEHKVFHEGLEEYAKYTKSVKDGKEKLDGKKLRFIMDSFIPDLRKHLVNEIQTLVQLEKYNDKVDWATWFQEHAQAMGKEKFKDADFRVKIFPFLLVFHDKAFENGVFSDYPPFPWIVLMVLRWMFVTKHANWWRFAPCSSASQPQELPFA